MKLYGGVQGGKRNKWLDFGSDPDLHADCPVGNPAITQQIMNGFLWNFQDSSTMMPGTVDFFFQVIWIAMLTLQIGNLGNIGVMSCFD